MGENAELLALKRIDETCVRLQEQVFALESLFIDLIFLFRANTLRPWSAWSEVWCFGSIFSVQIATRFVCFTRLVFES